MRLLRHVCKPLLLLLISASVNAVRNLQIATPLQALTIWDPEALDGDSNVDVGQAVSTESVATTTTKPTSFRSRFLAKFRAGLQAEVDARQSLIDATTTLQTSAADAARLAKATDWARQAALLDRQKHLASERAIEEAYDRAVAPFDDAYLQQVVQSTLQKAKQNPNKFQFVGVISPGSRKASVASKDATNTATLPPITWYARPKPKGAQWSVRLVHVNRGAILKDLYNRGKIDIFAHYDNTKQQKQNNVATRATATQDSTNTNTPSSAAAQQSSQPVVASSYSVRERSWKNLWNFSPKHVFTDSSGMYWRERRLPPGLYTDGQTVYEASYRYRDGRNGMHKVSTLDGFWNSRSVTAETKQKLQERLRSDTPDVVLEE